MKFVMVTTSHDYWDRLAGNTGMFSEAVVQDRILEDFPKGPVNTIFIKKNPQTRKFERAWTGRSKNFKRITRQERDYITFETEGLKRYDCPEVLRNKTVGCYILTEQLVEANIKPESIPQTVKAAASAPVYEKAAIEKLEDIASNEAPKFIPYSKRQNGHAKPVMPFAKKIKPVEEPEVIEEQDEETLIAPEEEVIIVEEPASAGPDPISSIAEEEPVHVAETVEANIFQPASST